MAKKKKKTVPAAAEPTRLFKVLTVDGVSPQQTHYKWTLPTQRPDGTWEPSPWHEAGPNTETVYPGRWGLHVTAAVDYYSVSDGRIAYEAEVAGESREHDDGYHHQVAAERVRLLRPVEWKDACDAGARRRKAAQEARLAEKAKARMDEIRGDAIRAAAAKKAMRDAGVPSPALHAMRTLAELTPRPSWRTINASRGQALAYATRWLKFDPEDVCTIAKELRGSHWIGADGGESYYHIAVDAGNTSACVAWERYIGRKPWWYRSGYDRKRERVYLGMQVYVDRVWYRITSFRDEYANAVDEGRPTPENKGKVVRLTREMLDPPATGAEVAE